MVEEVYSQQNRGNLYHHMRSTVRLDWSKVTKLFRKLLKKISFIIIRQAGEQVGGFSFPLSHLLILFSLLGCYFSGLFCTYHLGKFFVRFLTNTFYFYSSFFFHQLAINLSKKINFYSLLQRQVSSCFSLLRRLWLLRTLFQWKAVLVLRWVVGKQSFLPSLIQLGRPHFGPKGPKGLSTNYSHHA